MYLPIYIAWKYVNNYGMCQNKIIISAFHKNFKSLLISQDTDDYRTVTGYLLLTSIINFIPLLAAYTNRTKP